MRVPTLISLAAVPASANLMLSSGPSPIQRVTKLLKEMKDQLEEDRKADAKLFTDLQCWCKTNKKEKEAAIAQGKLDAKNLAAEIKKNSGSAGEHKAALEISQKAVKKAEEKLESTVASSEATIKGLKEDETDLVATVGALDNAIAMLSKHQGLVQKTPALIQSVASVLHYSAQKQKILRGNSPKMSNSFLQSLKGPESAFSEALGENYIPALNFDQSRHTLQQFVQTSQTPAHLQPHKSQSGGVFGILSQMQEDFTADLADTRRRITEETKGLAGMKKSIAAELKSQRQSVDDAKANQGKAAFLATEGEAELQKTRDAFAADTEVLSAVKDKCQTLDQDYALRTQARTDEVGAVNTAIEIMTSDESRDALFAPQRSSFIQVSAKMQSKREKDLRKAASNVLSAAANDVVKSWGSFEASDISVLNRQKILKQKHALVLAAQSAKLDAFTKVHELIDKMVVSIKKQMADDVKERDQCGVDIRQNEQDMRDATRLKSVTESNIEGLGAEIEELGNEIKRFFEEIAATKKSIKKASEDREAENANFQQEVSEQRDMRSVLQKAYTVLKTHYSKNEAATALIQQKQTPLPGDFTAYKPNAGSNSVLAMFEKIIADTHTSEKESMTSEKSSQKEYETFVNDANVAIEALAGEIAQKKEMKAIKTKNLSDEKLSLKETDTNVATLGQLNGALHGNCDFLIKFFEVRQQAMANEVAACQKAKAILSGAK